MDLYVSERWNTSEYNFWMQVAALRSQMKKSLGVANRLVYFSQRTAALSSPADRPTLAQPAFVSPDGEERRSDSKVVKCTCGKSKRFPFCDNSHRLPWYKLSAKQNIRGLLGGQNGAIYGQAFLACVGTFMFYNVISLRLAARREEQAREERLAQEESEK